MVEMKDDQAWARITDADGVSIRWEAPGRCWLIMGERFARQLYNELGDVLVKRASDVDAQLQEHLDVALRAHALAGARIEVLAADNSKLSKELFAAQEAHGVERRKVEAALKHSTECAYSLEHGRAELATLRTEVAKLRADNATLHTQVASAYEHTSGQGVDVAALKVKLDAWRGLAQRLAPDSTTDAEACAWIEDELKSYDRLLREARVRLSSVVEAMRDVDVTGVVRKGGA